MVDDRASIWAQECARLGRVSAEISRQLQAQGAVLEVRQQALEELRRFMFDSLHTAVDSAEEMVERAQHVQEHALQSALSSQTERVTRRLRALLSRPYFGRVDFAQTSPLQNPVESFYIGLQSLVGKNDEEFIYDWRTPVASLYYEYEPGLASYRLGYDEYAGELIVKRQYQIAHGELQSFFDSDVTVGDVLLCELLGKSTDGPMRSIVASIAREQNRALRLDARVLVIQGPAGSGKSSVAMQRIAYLLYQHRGHLLAEHIVMVSPHALFADYVKHVLPELGEENVWQTTFDLYARRWITSAVKVETTTQWWERMYTCEAGARESLRAAWEWKGSSTFRTAVLRFVKHVRLGGMPFVDITYKGVKVLSAGEQHAAFMAAHDWTPLAERLEKVRARIEEVLQKVIATRTRQWFAHLLAQDRYLGEQAELQEQAQAKATKESADIARVAYEQPAFVPHLLYLAWLRDQELFLAHTADSPLTVAQREAIRTDTLARVEQGDIARADLAAIMTLWQAMDREHIRSDIRQLVVDEAQDYTAHEWAVLAGLFPRARVTLLGDPEQALGADQRALVERIEDAFAAQDVQTFALTKSYRSTRQIRACACALGGIEQAAPGLARDGALVRRCLHAAEVLAPALLADLRYLLSTGMASLAILTRTAESSERLHAELSQALPIRRFATGDEAFGSGIVMMPAFLSKGLEFDAVLIVEAERYSTSADRSLLYVACTRALHVLHIYEEDRADAGCPWWSCVDATEYQKVTLT